MTRLETEHTWMSARRERRHAIDKALSELNHGQIPVAAVVFRANDVKITFY